MPPHRCLFTAPGRRVRPRGYILWLGLPAPSNYMIPTKVTPASWFPVLILMPGLFVPLAAEEALWDRVRSGAETAGTALEEGAEKGLEFGGAFTRRGLKAGKAAVDDTVGHFYREGTPAEIRARVDSMAYATLDRLFAQDPEAHVLFGSGYGYGVFEVRQLSLTVLAGYGYGVVASIDGSRRTYMKMARGGLELSKGVGGSAAQWVVLFVDRGAFDAFIDEGFDASAEASGTLGKEELALATRYREGVFFYRVTEGGLRLAVSLSGTRFWSDDRLNRTPAEVISGPDLGMSSSQSTPLPRTDSGRVPAEESTVPDEDQTSDPDLD